VGIFLVGLLNWIYRTDLSRRAEYGPGLYFPHPMGIVIGEKVTIGGRCVIFNDVTIGKKYPGTADSMPTIGAETILCVGSRILGGINICGGCVVAANAVISKDVSQPGTYFSNRAFKSSTYWNNYPCAEDKS
jgi:serine O-acetyltransferase